MGILSREIEIYKRMNKEHDVHFTFITFGDHEDENYKYLIDNLEIVPMYKYISKSKKQIVQFLKTLFGTRKSLSI